MKERMVTKQFNPLYRHMFEDLLSTGGSTYSYEGKKETGFAVGGFGKNHYHVEAKGLGQGDLLWFTNVVRKVVEEYPHLLSQNNYYIGTWLDPELNTLFIDIVRVFADKDEARNAAFLNDEKVIYDLGTKTYHVMYTPDCEYDADATYGGEGC